MYAAMIIGLAILFLGLPVSIIVTIVFAIKKRRILIPVICIPASLLIGLISVFAGGYLYVQTDEYKQFVAEKEQEELEKVNSEKYNSEIAEQPNSETEDDEQKEDYNEPSSSADGKPKPTELTEEAYKSLCDEVYYDDVFFGEGDLEGKYVKIHLFLAEKYYFTADDMHSEVFRLYDDKYNMRRDFFKASVLREGENSYVGVGKVNLWFSDDIEIDPNSYKTGEHIIVYAEVISWSNNTTSGYNSVTIIPKYIEEE